MKKTIIIFFVFIICLILIIIFKGIANDTNKTNESQNISTQDDLNNSFRPITIFETKYEQLIEIMGEPINITDIQDESIIINFGYFTILSYEGIEFTVYTKKDFELTNGTVVEIDITDTKAQIMGTDLNTTKDTIKDKYSIDAIHSLENTEEPISDFVLKGLKRGVLEVDLDNYDDYCYLKDKESSIAIIFLFENGLVKRILIRHLTAG